jgi:EmrB/QacA subfamily drug resistance transporter
MQNRKWFALAVVALGTFMTALDASIVNISLPSIALTFHAPVAGAIEWVVIAYLAVIAATLLTFGRLSDVVGRKPIWIMGLVVFTLGSAACGAAGSLAQLIVARIVQGIGGALIFAPSFAIITDAFAAAERGRALGLNSVVFAIATSLGPTLGGLITAHLTWRWVFYINVPLGVMSLIVSHRVLTRSQTAARETLDLGGAALIALGLASLTLALSFSQEWTWPSVLAWLVTGILSLVAAVFVEGRSPSPIVDLSLFRERTLCSALASMTVAMLALFAVGFVLPFYFEQLRGFSVMESGLLLTPLPLTMAIVAPLSGAMADRVGSRLLASGGLALATLGLVALARLGTTSTVGEIVGCLVLTGLGQGMFQSPNARALMNASPPGEQGETSSLYATSRVVGQSLSVALAGTVFAALGAASAGRALVLATTAPDSAHVVALQQVFVRGFRGTLLVCAAIAAVGVFVALVRGDERAERRVMTQTADDAPLSQRCVDRDEGHTPSERTGRFSTRIFPVASDRTEVG